jgi:hypothetical protein
MGNQTWIDDESFFKTLFVPPLTATIMPLSFLDLLPKLMHSPIGSFHLPTKMEVHQPEQPVPW